MPDIAELIRQEKLREQIEAEKQAESQAQQQDLQQNPVTFSDFIQGAKPAVLPTLGQIGGMFAGMATGPLAPAAVPALEAGGGMLGEATNQMLGITPPSNVQIGIQGLLPIGMRFGTAAARALPSSTKGVKLLHEIAPVEAKTKLSRLTPTESASDLFAQAETQGAKIPTLNTQATIKDVIDKRLTGGQAADLYKPTREYLERLGRSINRRQGALTPTQYQKELSDIRTMIGKAGSDVEKGALSATKRSLEDALDQAPAGASLAKARKASLTESVLKDIDEMTFKATKTKQGQGELEQFNANEVLRKIEKDEAFGKRFKKAFTPSEQRQIIGVYKKLNELPPLPSTQTNTNSLLSDVFRGGRAGIAAGMLGADPAIATGVGLASTLTRPALDTAKVFRLAMGTEEGRKILFKELTARKDKPLREIMQKVAVAMSASEPVQETVRQEFGTTSAITPFPNQR